MTEQPSRTGVDAPGPCPFCGASVQNSRYPRYQLILEDESESDANRRAEGRVCPECWMQVYEKLTPPGPERGTL